MIIRRKNKARNEQGFSFSELMIVIAIVGVLSAIALPAFLARLPDMRLRAAVRNVYADMQKVKVEAIKRNSCMGMDFTEGGGYTAFFDDDCDGDLEDPAQLFLSVSGTPGGADSLPGDVSLDSVNITNPFCYNSQGMICGSLTGNIVLTNGTLWGRVRIRPAGGLQIEMSNDGVAWY
ncbi:MAG: prepilin-type N-terminal cleavage/methylation domain-containing protein [Candidatus Electrothrix sp. ATG2]|nr:prepilin-type N-terminal cleavage/methylation domain-containing protein [Candidatus Electrothrix sp. ATG2]